MELGPVDTFGKQSHEIAPEEALGALPNAVIDFVCLDNFFEHNGRSSAFELRRIEFT